MLYSSSFLSSLPTHSFYTCRVLHILIFWRCVVFNWEGLDGYLGSRGVQSIKYYHVRLGGLKCFSLCFKSSGLMVC
jgi:hypothetical protein